MGMIPDEERLILGELDAGDSLVLQHERARVHRLLREASLVEPRLQRREFPWRVG
jgi:hypothetical protein